MDDRSLEVKVNRRIMYVMMAAVLIVLALAACGPKPMVPPSASAQQTTVAQPAGSVPGPTIYAGNPAPTVAATPATTAAPTAATTATSLPTTATTPTAAP